MACLISVVIPVYNAQEHLGDCLRSISGQDYEDFEIVAVNDGSQDSSLEILNGHADRRLRIVDQPNRGPSAAVNTGVEASRGAFIKLVDADDWLSPAHLRSQLDALAGAEGCVACCRWGYFVSNPAAAVVRQEHADRDYADPLEWIVDCITQDEGMMMGGYRWLIPRAIWTSAGGFDTRLRLDNDFEFGIRMLLASSGVRFAPGGIYSYRKGIAGAVSASQGRAAMESAFLSTELASRHLLQREDSPRIRRLCADRLQQWLFRFYPEFPDLAARAEARVDELGGSSARLDGGKLLNCLLPILGWKRLRRLQHLAYRCGWGKILAYKARRRLSRLRTREGQFKAS